MKKPWESSGKNKKRLDMIVSKAGSKPEAQMYTNLSNLIINNKGENKKTGNYIEQNSTDKEKKRNQKIIQISKRLQKNVSDLKTKNKLLKSCFEQQKTCLDLKYSKSINIKSKGNELSSGDEKLLKAFGIDGSFTLQPKIKNKDDSFANGEDEDEELEKSMQKNARRTLSLLDESLSSADEQNSQAKETNLENKKIKLKKNKLKFKGKEINVFNLKNNGSNLLIQKKVSMLSTQDSRKNKSGSFGLKDNPEFNMSHSTNTKNFLKNNNNSFMEFKEDQVWMNPQFYSYYPHGINNYNGHFNEYNIPKIKPKRKRNFMRIEDTTEYDIDLENITKSRKTTIMIRHIPNKYTKELMLETIDVDFKNCYDFFYLPIDFKNSCNVGYAFINFKDVCYVKPFFERFDGKGWACFNSEKVCSIKYARIQGKKECEVHFRDSSLMKQPVG